MKNNASTVTTFFIWPINAYSTPVAFARNSIADTKPTSVATTLQTRTILLDRWEAEELEEEAGEQGEAEAAAVVVGTPAQVEVTIGG
jgi:hypothetical protein